VVVYFRCVSIGRGNIWSYCQPILCMWSSANMASNKTKRFSRRRSWMVRGLFSHIKHETDDTPRVVALNIISLVLALLANLFLLFNFAKRIPYRVAQPFTITFWFVSSLILLSLICSIQISTPGISPAYYSSSRSLLPIQRFFANLLHMHSHKVITTPL